MTTSTSLPTLAADFPQVTAAQWRALVDASLKGADYDKRLVGRTADGLRVEPIYPRAVAGGVVARAGLGQPWGVCQRVDHPDAAQANALALADLDGGADHLTLAMEGSAAARMFGLRASDLPLALKGVMLDLIHVRLEPGGAPFADGDRLVELVASRGHDPSTLSINFGLDPIGQAAPSAAPVGKWTAIDEQLIKAVVGLRDKGFKGPFIAIDLRPYHEAGCSEAQELGAALATAVAYARLLTANGFSGPDAFAALSFTVPADADQMLGIAKIRALRRLMAQVQAASGIAAAKPIRIDAETAWRMMTRRDPWVNMLRTSMAAFAAGVGGADSVTVLPYTLPLGLPDGFARRVARNTQVVLLEESNLWRVADPAAGAGAIETLTDELARAGWAEFQRVEGEGGMAASLSAGQVQARIAKVRDARLRDVATRKAPLTGTSEFPNLTEAPVTVLMPPPAVTAVAGNALPSVRLASPFEALRDRADAAAKSGKPFTVFLACLGTTAEHSARSTWIRNLLAAGGISAVTTGDGFTNSADAGAAFAAGGARIACICGADATYAELAEATAMSLKNAGCGTVYLAGRPGELEAALTAAGVDAYVIAGQDVVALLTAMQKALA
jgi:methylmalonyl-CoA mutase